MAGAGAALSTTVTGGAQVRRRLDAVASQLNGRGLLPALRAAALIAQNTAKRKAPVLTGTLRRSIHMEDVGSDAVSVGTDLPYARRMEYGFAATDSLGRRYNQPARPYLRPALDENRGEMEREFASALEDMLRASLR
jgi:HK97 gp10 family phage protein